MFFKYRVYFLFVIFLEFSIDFCKCHIKRYMRHENSIAEDSGSEEQSNYGSSHHKLLDQNKHCWMRVNSTKHFEAMDKLDERYADVRKEYQDAAQKDNFDKQMLDVMVKTRGAAEREIQNAAGDAGLIPSGINLGGYFMMRMPNSLLFFHRIKLRNDTHFRVMYLRNDLVNMTLHAQLSLNDLHLQGSYDRSTTDKNPSILFYTPTYGQVEFLLKNVHYTFEGRYRLLKDRLTIELMISEIDFDDVMMTYLNNATNEALRLQRKNIDDFLIYLKSDLDKWLKEYFNDYLLYFGLVGANSNNKFQQYDKERATELNNYTDRIIGLLIQRLHQVKAEAIKLPKFTIFTVNNMELLLKNGVLRGLDSLHRRSIATGKKETNARKVDAVVGFSNLKVTYEYEALLDSDGPTLTGTIILSADELTTRMAIATTPDSESIDIQFEYLEQAKPESLTIEGSANRMIASFKYILEQHVIAIMSNTLRHNIKMLGSLTRCVPLLHVYHDSNNFEEETINLDTENEHELSTPHNLQRINGSATLENSVTVQYDQQPNISKTSPSSDKLYEENLADSLESEAIISDKKSNNDVNTGITTLVRKILRKRIK